jgi:hypothetical protein
MHFFSKQASFLAFQIAQQQAANPNILTPPPGNALSIQGQNCSQLEGLDCWPKHMAITPQTTLPTGQENIK